MTTDMIPTTEDLEIRADQIREGYVLPLRLAYEALANLHEAINMMGDLDRKAGELSHLAETHHGEKARDRLTERSGYVEFFDVVAAIEQLANTRTEPDIPDSYAISDWLALMRMEQLEGVDSADDFTPRWPRVQRLEHYRRQQGTLSLAEEATVRRILADEQAV